MPLLCFCSCLRLHFLRTASSPLETLDFSCKSIVSSPCYRYWCWRHFNLFRNKFQVSLIGVCSCSHLHAHISMLCHHFQRHCHFKNEGDRVFVVRTVTGKLQGCIGDAGTFLVFYIQFLWCNVWCFTLMAELFVSQIFYLRMHALTFED